MICEYGCNQEAKFELKNKKWCCSKSWASCSESKRKNSEGLKRAYKDGMPIRGFASDKRLQQKSRESYVNHIKEQPFEKWGKLLKIELILDEQDKKCCECKIVQEWNGKILKFELDHIDGNSSNDKRENLRLLCPNCHSQTTTWKGRGKKSFKFGCPTVNDEVLIDALKSSINIRQALIKAGLTGRGYNYVRVYRLIMEHNIKMPL